MSHGNTSNCYTHIGSRVKNSAKIWKPDGIEDGWYICCFNETDPAHGPNNEVRNAFDLVRLHKFGKDDIDVKPHTPIDKYPSYIKMREFVDNLPEVQEYKHKKAIEDYKTNPDAKLDALFFKNNKFQKEVFCKYLIDNEHVCNIDGRLHIYDDGVYIDNEKLIHLKMIKLLTHTSKAIRNECIDYLDNALVKNEKTPDIDYIAFKNRTI